MRQALRFTLLLLSSASLLADHVANSDGSANQSIAASYQDIALQSAKLRYALSTQTLQLGIPRYHHESLDDNWALYPPDHATLLNNLLKHTNSQHTKTAIKVTWTGNVLSIQLDPVLTAQMDYQTLLQSALTLIQQANNNHMPIITGRILKTALEQKNGVPMVIFQRKK